MAGVEIVRADAPPRTQRGFYLRGGMDSRDGYRVSAFSPRLSMVSRGLSSQVQKYLNARLAAINHTNRYIASGQIPALLGLSAGQTDSRALEVWTTQWRGHPGRHPAVSHWDWAHLVERPGHDLFAVAIWHGDRALNALGLIRAERHWVTIERLEAHPGAETIRGGRNILIVADLAVRYAKYLKREKMRFWQPMDDKLVNHYCTKLGCALAREGEAMYCWRPV